MSKTRPFVCAWCGKPQRIVLESPDIPFQLCSSCFELFHRQLITFDNASAAKPK